MSVWGMKDLQGESKSKFDDGAPFKLMRDTVITVLSGAGISAESGIPTFRGADGLWNDPKLARLATPYGFADDPEAGWNFYNDRRANMAKAEPNNAHITLANLESLGFDIVVITQNIDRLHQKAGSKRVIELHGTVWEIKCGNPSCALEPFENTDVPIRNVPLYCDRCGTHLRPNVVFFEEMLDPLVIQATERRTSMTELFMVVGTSGTVYPAAGFAHMARACGAYTIEFNIEKTPLSPICHMSVFGPCGESIPKTLTELSGGIVKFQ